MPDVATWLRHLGLEQYARTFAENGIDIDVLPELTDADLQGLGVLLGHRRRMLRAVADGTAAAPPSPQQEEGERRQLSVMFCDLSPVTVPAPQLDPEDMRRVIHVFQACCADTVRRYDGLIAQFLGDGVMVYFGYPRAHGDDAERAVRAGLDIIAAMDRRATPKTSRVRVGIATGTVVVGDLIGRVTAQERAVVGETPNLAARLHAVATPGEVVISRATRRLLGDLFIFPPLGPVPVKGLDHAIEAWAVAGASSATSRFEAARTGSLTQFVGRETEVALLQEARERAWRGQGRVVLISGEAGIGKSRFIAAFSDATHGSQSTRLRYQCSPYHTASTLHPVIEQLRWASGIDEADSNAAKLAKLEALVRTAVAEPGDTTALFAALLAIPSPPNHPPLGYGGARQRRQTLASLLDQLEGLARRQPVLLLFEDIHWADPTTLELLDLMIERVRALPVLALITHRPEFEAPWIGLDNVTTIPLDRLSHDHVRTMIGWLTAGKTLPEEVAAEIYAKTDGVPLFVEELTKAVLESALLVRDGTRYHIKGKLPPLAVPFTLQDSLMARLDHLAPVREIAQVGAAIGREFSLDLLGAVAGREQTTLNEALVRLESAGLLFRLGSPPHIRYRFKHALVRDAAYESLLRSRRQVLHQRIATTLRDRFPRVAATEPELIAHHFAEAGLLEGAIPWWVRAAEQAVRRSAYLEAISHYREAIQLTESQPDSDERRRLLIRLFTACGDALSNARSPGAPETREAYARARMLAAEITAGSERYPVYHGLWTGSVVRADLASMRELAEMFRADIARCPGTPEAGLAARFVGVYLWMSGDLPNGQAHLEAAVAAYEQAPEHDSGFQLDLHPGVAAMLQLAMARWLGGDEDQACLLADRAVKLADGSGHTPTVLYGHTWAATLHALRDDAAAVSGHAGILSRMGQEHDLPFWQAIGRFLKAWADWRMNAGLVDLECMHQSLELLQDQGLVWYVVLERVLMAAPLAAAEGVDAGLAMIDAALDAVEATGLSWLHPLALRQHDALFASKGGAGASATVVAGQSLPGLAEV
jgi:predicted ATPase/class 3 adenylate cyclase